ncbi:hypothetical protein JCM10213_007819 [Rhodosporidiobolus nylandii]
MAPLRTRQSSYSSRVTLYEPSAASTSSSAATPTSSTSSSLPASAGSPVCRTRSRTAAGLAEADEERKPDVKPSKGKEKEKKPRSPRKPKVHVEALAVPHPPPKNWETTYEVIRKQREGIVAPVDNMGCEQGGQDRQKKDQGDDDKPAPVESEQDRRLSILVSLMLSSQTKDPVTHQATMNLRTDLPGGLTLSALESATAEEIDACICKVGFHNTKANNLKRLAVTLREKHGGEVPGDLKSLLDIHGVGPKMAYLYLQAIGENLGIGVDTHVHRITNRLRWHKKETTTPEQTRLNLESWLPRHLWPQVNKMLVGFGQEICRPTAPRCDLCDVATARLCPSRRVVSPSKSPAKKRLKVEVKEEEKVEVDGEDGEPALEIKLERKEVREETLVGAEVKREEEDGRGKAAPTESTQVREAQEELTNVVKPEPVDG